MHRLRCTRHPPFYLAIQEIPGGASPVLASAPDGPGDCAEDLLLADWRIGARNLDATLGRYLCNSLFSKGLASLCAIQQKPPCAPEFI